jgi:hypothetical protein
MADFDIDLALSLEGHTWPERAKFCDPKSKISLEGAPRDVDAPTGTIVLNVRDQKAPECAGHDRGKPSIDGPVGPLVRPSVHGRN